jgi:hypothetical protein
LSSNLIIFSLEVSADTIYCSFYPSHCSFHSCKFDWFLFISSINILMSHLTRTDFLFTF